MKRLITAGLAALAVAGLAPVAPANAAYDYGCERVDWGFLFSGYRTICDGPMRPDGSWERTRREWTPAGYMPVSCYGRYYISCSGGYYYDESTQRLDTYIVFDHNVLPNEPGWLPPGTVRIL
jgi:hypothetical protein